MDYNSLIDLPKVELHNHLDGGLRIQTVIDLAEETDYDQLPSHDPQSLADWFLQDQSGSLEQYLAGFVHTIGVMQTPAAIARVALEAGLDVAADGVVYAEIRFAPSLNTERGMRYEDVIEAALSGFQGAEDAVGIKIRLIVDAMRHEKDSLDVVEAAVRFADQGVVGFDLAGPEAGYPPEDHLEACRLARQNGLGLTIHAGEGDGPESIRRAVETCGAQRIGHGIRIIEDINFSNGTAQMGPIASMVHERQIPLEVCPTSNLHTLGIKEDMHPLGKLLREGFNVTLSTDNRLMSAVTLTDEFALAVKHHGFTRKDLHKVTVAALEAAFVGDSVRQPLLQKVEAGYAS